MDTAINIAKNNSYTFRIVTLDGDVINSSGSITGGSFNKKTVNILGRSREIERLRDEIKNLNTKIENKKSEKIEYENNANETLENIKLLDKELQEVNITYATEKQKVLAIEESVQKNEQKVEKLKKEWKNLQSQKENTLIDEEKLKNKITELNNQTEELNKIISEYAESNKEQQKYIDDLNFDITNLKISVSSFDESESSIEEIQERINLEIMKKVC